MDQSCFVDDLFYFISLQMTDHMPVNILWKGIMLLAEFLNIVLTEVTYPGTVKLFDILLRLCLADCDQRDILRIPARAGAGLIDVPANSFIIFQKHLQHLTFLYICGTLPERQGRFL